MFDSAYVELQQTQNGHSIMAISTVQQLLQQLFMALLENCEAEDFKDLLISSMSQVNICAPVKGNGKDILSSVNSCSTYSEKKENMHSETSNL